MAHDESDGVQGTTALTARPCGVVVDGSAALPEDLDSGLAVVPVRIRIGDQEFVDCGDANQYALFYERLRAGEAPITSTPSPGEYLEAFRRNPAPEVVCLTIPERWSGMFGAASVAADMLEQEEGRRRVRVVETEAAAVSLGLIARVAARLAQAGSDTAVITDSVRRAGAEVRMYGSLATLTYVARSGRVPALIAGISNTLHVRPVFRMQGGETGRVALARTTSGVLDALGKVAAETFGAVPQQVLVFHADAVDGATQLAARLERELQIARCDVVALSPIAGAYTGPGAFGFASLPAAFAA
ncbi:MAG: DegV family protein [Candidatus Dormibacteraeota bacterium]|nr:DegV family protein [Candidatus Dormibacteraeota bacterium]